MNSHQKLPLFLQRLTEVGVGIVGLAMLVAVIGILFTDVGLDIPIQFAPDRDAYSLESDEWGSGEIRDGSGIARFEDRSAGLTALFVGAVLAYAIPSIVLLVMLRAVLKSFAQRNPLVVENAKRVRWVGITVILFGIAVQAMETLAAVVAMNHLTVAGLHLEARLVPDLAVVFVGLVIVVIAEAFRHGAHLQTEADLTV